MFIRSASVPDSRSPAVTTFYISVTPDDTPGWNVTVYTSVDMFGRPNFSLSSGTRLIVLAAVAVMLPTTVLCVIQYRSLADLEGKTKAAVQENLRQTLQGVARDVEGRFKGLAGESLVQLGPEDLKRENLGKIGSHYAAVRQRHPAVDQLFVVSNCSCQGGSYALLYTPQGNRLVEHTRYKEDQDVLRATKAYESAGLLHPANSNRDTVLWQSACPTCDGEGADQLGLYVFRPMFEAEGRWPVGFAGLTLNPSYLKEKLFAEVALGLSSGGSDGGSVNPDLVLGVFDENRREVYASTAGDKNYEVRMALGPMFPDWELALGYKDMTIAALARDNFQRSLMLSVFVLGCLILGIILTLRATAREMKLAQAKSTFVSNVSHELKTPLALIRLFAETLELGRVKNSDKAQEYYRIINNESQRLTQLINNVLDFAKIEAGRKDYRFTKADTARLVEDVIRSYEYQIINAGFELKVDIEHNLPSAMIDRDALSQAVLNLLNNAVKYSDDVKRISVRVRLCERHVAIEVADQGVGIPRSEQEKIFEKFYRVSAGLVHDTKGSGLGLALVRHIVEAHGGQALVESAPGRGSCFTILLPASIETETAAKQLGMEVGGYQVAESTDH